MAVGMGFGPIGGVSNVPYLVFRGLGRSRKREKCYRTIDIIEQMGSCRIISNYGYSLGAQRSSCGALVGYLRADRTQVAGRGRIGL